MPQPHLMLLVEGSMHTVQQSLDQYKIRWKMCNAAKKPGYVFVMVEHVYLDAVNQWLAEDGSLKSFEYFH